MKHDNREVESIQRGKSTAMYKLWDVGSVCEIPQEDRAEREKTIGLLPELWGENDGL